MLKRIYLDLLEEYLKYFPCVAVIGPRQCGKTTLIKELEGKWEHFDLELHADYEQISNDPDLFLRANPEGVVIDEAQLLPPLFNALRVAIDRDKKNKGRYVISGSSSPELLSSISESLAGRVGIIEMAPLSFGETLQKTSSFFSTLVSKPDIHDFLSLKSRVDIQKVQTYWLKGGYPEPWVEGDDRFHDLWMQQYITTYLNKDIGRLFPGLNRQKFRLFLQTLAALNGSIINYSDVARSLSLSPPTIREYFQIAHGTFLWRIVPSYEKNTLKRIVKHPKGYYRDSGLLNYLLRIAGTRDLLSYPNRGNMWEAVVIEEIIRSLTGMGIDFDYYYYRTSAGAEVDLIIEGKFGLIPFEIKQGQTVEARSLKSIKSFVDEHQCPFGIVINNDERVRLYSDKIIGIPFAEL